MTRPSGMGNPGELPLKELDLDRSAPKDFKPNPLFTEVALAKPEVQGQEKRALNVLGLTALVFDGRDPVKDSLARFKEETNALIKDGKLTATEGQALKKLGDHFITGNWPGLAQAARALKEDSAEKVLDAFKKIVETNANEKPNAPKQLRMTVAGDGKDYTFIFEGEKVNGGNGQLRFSSQDNSLKFTNKLGKVLVMSADDRKTALSTFKDFVCDQFASHLEEKDDPKRPKEADKELSPTAKDCLKALESQLKLLYPGNEVLRNSAVEVFKEYAKDDRSARMLNGIQEKYDKTDRTDHKMAEIERAGELMSLLNAWLVAAGKAKRTDIQPTLASEQIAYKEFPDPQGKVSADQKKNIERGRELVKSQFDGTADLKQRAELNNLRRNKESFYTPQDSSGLDLGVKAHELKANDPKLNYAAATMRLVELSQKSTREKLSDAEKIEVQALSIFRNNDPRSQLARGAYMEGSKLKSDGKLSDEDMAKLKANLEIFVDSKDKKKVADAASEIKELLKKK